MGELATRTQIQIGSRTVTVREWTLADVRAHFSAPPPEKVDTVDALLVEGFYLRDIPRFTDLTLAELEDYTPSQLGAVAAEIKRVNADFFRTAALAVALAEKAATAGAS